MALTMTRKKVEGVRTGEVTLHSALAASDDGDWVDMEGIGDWSIHVSGIGTDTLKAHGSNKATIPADGDSEITLGSDITADGIREYSAPIKWFKVSVVRVDGTITVVLKARNH